MKKNLSLLVASIALLFVSCGGPIKTGSATEVTHSSAVLHGELNVALDQPIEFGVVIAESEEALINSTDTFKFIVTEHKEGVFELPLNRFIPETDYYYYAWLVKDGETLVGKTENFTTSSAPTATFSVGEAKKVVFSPGNLQYNMSTDSWNFAKSQLEFLGEKNDGVESGKGSGIIDLFAWTSGQDPFIEDYDGGEFHDWGGNKIGNDAPNTWRTLASKEWSYMLKKRANSVALKGIACVDDVNGLIILPDDWNNPIGVNFRAGFSRKSGDPKYFGLHQTITIEQWQKMEKAGAVFLPASGARNGDELWGTHTTGVYWSSTSAGKLYNPKLWYDMYFAYYMAFVADDFTVDKGVSWSLNCVSVRLVKDVE